MTRLSSVDQVRALKWQGTYLSLLDQRQLPHHETWIQCHDATSVASAIRDLLVRGAPAIGIAAAYGVVLAARQLHDQTGKINSAQLQPTLDMLRSARPTAVNLFWAIARMEKLLNTTTTLKQLEQEAQAIETEDLAANHRMGELGSSYLDFDCGVLTHCNTGSLATAGFGTALGVIRAGYAQKKITRVFNTETRPWLQGARLTSWELKRDQIPSQLIADSAGAHLMASGQVQWLIVGADRICANGDVANKIGTSQLAIAARYYQCKVMVVAPSTTIDMNTAQGSDISIELRDPGELLAYAGTRVVADGVTAWNPVFDITPAEFIDVIVTERGAIEKPNSTQMQAVFSSC
jgi:methylthioribose-1-phosphate isomerase